MHAVHSEPKRTRGLCSNMSRIGPIRKEKNQAIVSGTRTKWKYAAPTMRIAEAQIMRQRCAIQAESFSESGTATV
jgi:hypothetical protein